MIPDDEDLFFKCIYFLRMKASKEEEDFRKGSCVTHMTFK